MNNKKYNPPQKLSSNARFKSLEDYSKEYLSSVNDSDEFWSGNLPLARLLEDAIYFAEDGVSATHTLAKNLNIKLSELKDQPGFMDNFQIDQKLLLKHQTIVF